MRKTVAIVFWLIVVAFAGVPSISAQTVDPDETLNATSPAEATQSGEATRSGIIERVTERKPDLTEPTGEVKGRLERLIIGQQLSEPSVTNFLKHLIKNAVTQGVPANTIVLLLLFPLVVALIAASRHLIGLVGFGIFTPAIVSVGFLATGIVNGLLLFGFILLVASLGRVVVTKLKLLYLPRMSLLLWLVSVMVLILLLLAPQFDFGILTRLSIFPILLLVLLAETFIDVQTKKNRRQALEMTMETLLLAVVSYLVMSLESVQTFVLLHPEITILAIGLFNFFLGRYEGLRLLEYLRFREILR